MKDKGGVAIPDKPELRFPEIVLDLSVLDDHTVEYRANYIATTGRISCLVNVLLNKQQRL
jgi:hypothetical protein